MHCESSLGADTAAATKTHGVLVAWNGEDLTGWIHGGMRSGPKSRNALCDVILGREHNADI